MVLPNRNRSLLRGLLVAILVSLSVVAVPAAKASLPDPSDLCAAQLAALQAVHDQIDAHNAKPHTFRIPSQQAAADAYNAEAASLNAQQEAARTKAEACIAAMTTLTDATNTTLPLTPISPSTRTALTQAKAKVPANWQPTVPRPGKQWEVARTDPARDVFDLLRKGNPGRIGDVMLQGRPRPSLGARDPAYRGGVIGQVGGRSGVHPDHIIPIARIVNMPNFMKLTPDNMWAVARAPFNLQWMSAKANLSKQAFSVSEMSGVDPAWQAEQSTLESSVAQKLQDLINQLLSSQS